MGHHHARIASLRTSLSVICLAMLAACPDNPGDDVGDARRGADGADLQEGNAEHVEELVREIRGTEDFFSWYGIRTVYGMEKGNNPRVLEALSAKERELGEADPPRVISPQLELVAFDFRWVGVSNSKRWAGKDEYRATWLFYVGGKIDRDGPLILRGYVKKEHRPILLKKAQRKQGFIELTQRMDPVLSAYPEGEYFLISSKIVTTPVPCRLETWFAIREKGRFTSYGKRIDLGEFDLSAGAAKAKQ